MSEFTCKACGNYRDTPGHELGCLPFHTLPDPDCTARSGHEPTTLSARCYRCFPLLDSA